MGGDDSPSLQRCLSIRKEATLPSPIVDSMQRHRGTACCNEGLEGSPTHFEAAAAAAAVTSESGLSYLVRGAARHWNSKCRVCS